MKAALGVLVLGALGCGAASPAPVVERHEEVARHEETALVDAAVPPPQNVDAGPADDGLAALQSELEAQEPNELSTLGHVLDGCPRGGDECVVPMTALWSDGRWIVLDVDASEGGSDSYVLWSSTPSGEIELARGTFDRAGRARFSAASQQWRSALPPTDRIGSGATQTFSSSDLVALVTLTAPLTGSLWLRTTTDLDHPEHVLTLIQDDGTRVELGRRTASLGPCDGGGMACERMDWEPCTREQLRAEDRLCVEPIGISSVSLAPDGASIAVLGIEGVAGDGGYPPFHWVVAWPTFGGP